MIQLTSFGVGPKLSPEVLSEALNVTSLQGFYGAIEIRDILGHALEGFELVDSTICIGSFLNIYYLIEVQKHP